MKINKFGIVLFLLVCAMIGSTRAEGISGLTVIKTQTDLQNDSLYIELEIDLEKIKVKPQEALILTPVIETEGQTEELPAIFIGGKYKYKSYKRAQAFGKAEMAFISLHAKEDETSVINYYYAVPYQPWMKEAKMSLKEEIYGCANCQKSLAWLPLTEAVVPFMPSPLLVTYIMPSIQDLHQQENLSIEFKVNKYRILPDFRNNAEELAYIDSLLETSQKGEGEFIPLTNILVDSIVLTGYASPEGPYRFNEKLSENRALSVKRYLKDKYDCEDSLVKVRWKGEDWKGLKKLIEKSDLKEKNVLLSILDSSQTDNMKDYNIRRLSGGTVYRYLLREYYPSLRRTDVEMNYVVPLLPVSEYIEKLSVSPSTMSLNEMYVVANAYPEGSREFNQVFNIAATVYPSDLIANINAGAAALENGDVREAHRYLDNLKDKPQAWNNLGVMYWLEGNSELARKYFLQAKETKSEEAIRNLEEHPEIFK